MPIAQITDATNLVTGVNLPSRITYYYNDHLGVARLGMNQNQEKIWRATPTVFGKDFQEWASYDDGLSVSNPLRFPGQYYDKETNTNYNYHRNYDRLRTLRAV